MQHGELQDHTGVFDIGALPSLPGLKALACKAKAKPKAQKVKTGKGKAAPC